MSMTPDDVVQASLDKSVEDFAKARLSINELANELANVADVIEPVLSDQVKRIREARMASTAEIGRIADAVRDLRTLLVSKEADQMVTRAERLLAVLKELEEFRACGSLEAFSKAFAVVTP
jgi:negative regulator of replication initiation